MPSFESSVKGRYYNSISRLNPTPMSKILPFKRPRPAERHKGNTLCRRGFHQWQVDKEKQFDSRQGRLVTILRCKRCGATKTRAI